MGEMLSLTSLLGGAPVTPDALLGLTPVETPGAIDPFAELLATMVEASGAAAMPLPAATPVQPGRIAMPVATLPEQILPADAAPEATVTAPAPTNDAADADDEADAAVAAILAALLPLAPPRPAAAPVEEKSAEPAGRPAPQQPITASMPKPARQPAPEAAQDDAGPPSSKPAQAAPVPAAAFAAVQALIAKTPEQPKQPVPAASTSEAEPARTEGPPAPAPTTQAPAPVPARNAAEVRPTAHDLHERPAPERTPERDPVARDVADIALPGFAAPATERREQAAAVVAPADVAETGTVQRHLAVAQDGLWLDQLARDITRSAGNGSDLHFKLAPANLGSLTVQIAQVADGASIRITTDTEQAHTLIHDAQPRLVAEARAQGLKVSDTQVDLSQRDGGGSGAWGGASSAWSQAGQQSGQRQPQGQAPLPVHQPSAAKSGVEEPARPLAAASERYA